MKDNSFMFPNYPRHILWENQLVQNALSVKNQRFVNNDIRFFCYGSVYRGPLVHVENNLMEYGIYGCGPMGCGAMFVPDGDKPVVTRNTIRYTQQWHGIVWLGSGFEASYNHLHDLATVRDDASMFQTKFAGELQSHIHHNWAYNSELKGVRYDTCGGKGDKGYPGCAGAVWNNVFFNSHQGANIKGDHQLVVGNTAFANGKRVDITVSPKGVGGTEDGFIYNKYSTTHNNAVDILSASDSRCGLPLPGKSSSNYASRCPPKGSQQASTAMKDLLRDPFNLDFRPRNVRYPKGLVGGATSSVPKFTAGGGRKVDVAGGKDLGAYQSNADSYFIPGKMFQSASTPVPPHTTTTARVDLDLMFLGGSGATHHDVYVSKDPCRALTAVRGSSEHITRVQAPRNIVPPGKLEPAVWYYWRVDVVSKDGGIVRGPVWCFAVGSGAGGCSRPPCSDPQGIKGRLCATDSGSEQPRVPEGCKTSPTTTTPGISSTTSGTLECKDRNPRCAKWKRQGKCSKTNVEQTCPKSCGVCDSSPSTTLGVSSTTSGISECKDKNPRCAKWKRQGKCSRSTVKAACPKSCGVCTI